MMKIIASDMPPLPDKYFVKAHEVERIVNDRGLILAEKYEAVLALVNEIVTDFIAGYATCRRGCNHCCQSDVQVTLFEARYITLRTGIPVAEGSKLSIGNSTSCPFLKNGECSIYDARPFVCRTFHAMGDPDNCKPGNIQLQYGTPNNDYSNVVFREFARWIKVQNETMNQDRNDLIRDIRDYFPR